MVLKLSLTAKTLILISVPLCFELGFVWLLTQLQNEAESEANRAVEARMLSDRINKLSSDIFGAYSKYGEKGRLAFLKKGFLDNENKVFFGTMRTDFQELTKLTHDKPDLFAAVVRAEKQLDQAEALLHKAAEDIDAGHIEDILKTYPDRMDHLRVMLSGLISQDLVLSARHEREIADTSHERQSEIRNRVLEFALVACVANVVFSVLLAYFLVRNVTSKIQILNDNSRKLSLGQPLHQPLPGNDEIAELDRVFHNMAASIDEVARMKQELVLMLTHDMRSPLTAIQGSLEMISKRSSEFDEQSQKLISLANRNSARMASLIDDLLDIQKIKSGMMTLEVTQICLAETFEAVRENVADWISAHGITLNIEDTDLFVKGDEKKLARVVFNLVSNAVKFSGTGTTISLGAKKFRNNQVEVTVADQGPGIPPDMLDSIFERFQQVDNEDTRGKGGSGLGLAVCHAIVGLHGGRIWVTSELGQGSTFHFTAPEA